MEITLMLLDTITHKYCQVLKKPKMVSISIHTEKYNITI
jgi:hypothetical protein